MFSTRLKGRQTCLPPEVDIYKWIYFSSISVRRKYPSFITGLFNVVVNIWREGTDIVLQNSEIFVFIRQLVKSRF